MADSMERNMNPNIDFLYRTMLERDPHKRRVKPVSSNLLQLDFAGLDCSSDDSDFELPQGNSDDDDDDDIDNEDNDDDTAGNSSRDDENSQSASDNDDDDDDDEDDDDEEDDNGSVESEREDGESVTSIVTKSTASMCDSNQKAGVIDGSETVSGGRSEMRVLVCCVCLRDDNVDEMVECDSCCATVHEGCYGVTENESMCSSESSASTEPWFCDSCKAGVLKPNCELCPSTDGVFKETDTGRWIHLVCALYVPGVAFGDVDRLSNATLFEMSYYKWGAKECSLCDDVRFSRTGVCIGCDAGMCRTFFHVTCAQREGLLTEAASDEEIADPFFAYCKQHSNKTVARMQRKNWLAARSHIKSSRQKIDLDPDNAARLKRKLQAHQDRYRLTKENKAPGWVPPEKLPRLLLTNAHALRQLIKKAELLGIDPAHQDEGSDVRKKWHIAPSFSTDYVGYYLDREGRISSLRSDVQTLIGQKEKLQKQEKILSIKYSKLQSESTRLRRGMEERVEEGERLWGALTSLPGAKNLKLPESMNFRKVNVVKGSLRKSITASTTSASTSSCLHTCETCRRSTDQHLLAHCDKCKLYYHLSCLNPPLTRMPKKTRQQGWQCSVCAESSGSERESSSIDTRAPRRLRNTTLLRQPTRFTLRRIESRVSIMGRRRRLGALTRRGGLTRRPVKRRAWSASTNRNNSASSTTVAQSATAQSNVSKSVSAQRRDEDERSGTSESSDTEQAADTSSVSRSMFGRVLHKKRSLSPTDSSAAECGGSDPTAKRMRAGPSSSVRGRRGGVAVRGWRGRAGVGGWRGRAGKISEQRNVCNSAVIAKRRLSDVLNRLAEKRETSSDTEQKPSTKPSHRSLTNAPSVRRGAGYRGRAVFHRGAAYHRGRLTSNLRGSCRSPGRPRGSKNRKISIASLRSKGHVTASGSTKTTTGAASSNPVGQAASDEVGSSMSDTQSQSDTEVQIIEISDEDSWNV